jgi:hypothetical protein
MVCFIFMVLVVITSDLCIERAEFAPNNHINAKAHEA